MGAAATSLGAGPPERPRDGLRMRGKFRATETLPLSNETHNKHPSLFAGGKGRVGCALGKRDPDSA